MSIGEKNTFWKLIHSSSLKSIQIPQIQRDYVQGRNTDKVTYARKRMLSEIYDSLVNDAPLDLNFVYGKVEDGVFIPIDGQQRLTTLFCLHVYAFAQEGDTIALKEMSEKFQYATRVTTTRFLAALLEHIPEFFQQSEQDMIPYLEDAAWYSPQWDKDPSVRSFKVVLGEIHKMFHDVRIADKLKMEVCPATFMSLQIPDVGRVNDLYIKMNSRGKLLTEFESFKSEMFEFIDTEIPSDSGIDKREFKEKIDNEWLNLVWRVCGAEAPNLCDTVYMRFIHQIFMNRLIPQQHGKDHSEEWANLNKNNGFFNFADYKPYLKNIALLNDLYCTFEFYKFIMEAQNDAALAAFPEIRRWLVNLMMDSGKLGHSEQVRLLTITRYAVLVPRENWTIAGYIKWFRVMNNLINNTQIDKAERCIAASRSLMTIPAEMAEDTYAYLLNTNGMEIVYFDNRQVKEEVFKCRFLEADARWEAPIFTAEKDEYFSGEIQFVFSLCGLRAFRDVVNHEEAIERFIQVWETIKRLFYSMLKEDKRQGNDNLFRRALLTYGDYSCQSNSSYTFFPSGDRYFNWRRMLRDAKSLAVFTLFFDDFKNSSLSDDVATFLQMRIDAYSDKNDEFIYYTIKLPQIMEFMTKKRFRPKDTTCDRNIFYSKERLSADYAEANTFFVYHSLSEEAEYHYGQGYLSTASSVAYINKVKDISCHIEYCPKGYYCDQNGQAYLDDRGQPIATVEKMVCYIEQHF
ncbi:MAG: DUF262 domain-containing protein [Ruminococcaceae bacterium]|nr:DUF262 domain-containing protein [Oscillospiraceae bacterium]